MGAVYFRAKEVIYIYGSASGCALGSCAHMFCFAVAHEQRIMSYES